MRELLFRAKRLDTGEWVEGNYCAAEYITSDGIEYLIIEVPRNGCSAKINPETVGQYTGLNANGKKIFEGDIVRHGNRTGYINYVEGCFCVKQIVPLGNLNNPAIDIVFNEYPNDVEVIGNVYDNPEMLEGME